ncbi:hypothetical protein [Bradyrhizobium liaoningense]|nr:hypothetical protein [Bradyrhizobium liaoningense]MBR0712843.1 hypothetical protein [Bradyrhizobium liaoningense]
MTMDTERRTFDAQTCKLCAEQQKASMKNYAGPACKTEYQNADVQP